MYDNPAYNAKNEKILCEMGGKNAEMLMDIRVKLLSAGESVTICDAANETAVMLLAGEVKFAFDGKEETAKRQSPFAEKPYCLHFSKGLQVKVTALEDSRILIKQTDNDNDFGFVWYTPADCMLQEFGKAQWNGTAHRQVLTVFDYESAPYSNMVLGEVFDKPQGFGVGFNGDECYKVENGGCLSITPMKTHQQVAAPGYSMYYVWMIRHLDGDPWRKTRIDAPEHKWLLDAE